MKFGADIHGSQRINPYDFGDPLTFPLAPAKGQHLSEICKNYEISYMRMNCNHFGDPFTFHSTNFRSNICPIYTKYLQN